ncbi:ribosome maturation protein SDO1 [Angomonas deanei]|uniref:SBDS protein C-terminal domain containing protein, putative n=1 Tax=Angomonas deanei TaxID=59799 RepID=A0A7G2C7D5_9TRYP|nr:ribosome maturation protein SDO1 [Angomonas deanei]CAD2215730.1 SBDS protein C-terminal domain containing protein, putative [Angomonas deanei]|eukprot:EPY23087.1 ribosome maturation protein SDO1 [Angomonas deanei]
MTEEEAIKFMLLHGELQVAQHERTAEVDEIFKDICLIISQKCINTKTQRPFPPQMVEQALRSMGASAKLDQPPKKQALQFIHQLIEEQVIPIARAPMRVRVTVPAPTASTADTLEAWCVEHEAIIEEKKETEAGPQQTSTFLVNMQPNWFKELDTFIRERLSEGSTAHVVEATVHEEGELDLAHVVTASQKTASVQNSLEEGATNHPGDGANRGGKGKGGKRGKKKGKHDDDSSDEEDAPEVVTKAKGKKKAVPESDLAAELDRLQLGLGPHAASEEDTDSDDEKTRKKGGRRNKKKKKSNAKGGENANDNNNNAEMDSDEELAAGNRKKRKNKN